MRERDNTTVDRTGEVFGLLTVVARADNDTFGRVYWQCVCRCGDSVKKSAHQLRSGTFFTCGKPARRFWEKVYIPDADSCWEWTAARHEWGYGVFRVAGKNVRAHIFSWELANKQIVPPEILVLHRCDNPPCVRPEHLFLGTHKDNMADMAAKGCSREPRPPLSETMRAGLLRDYAEGLTHDGLVEKYGVSYTTVRRILRQSGVSTRKDGGL